MRTKIDFYGETICVSDGTLETALANAATPEVQILVPGNPELAMMDNIAYQPVTGNWLINEDGAGKRYFVSIQHNITGSGVVFGSRAGTHRAPDRSIRLQTSGPPLCRDRGLQLGGLLQRRDV